MCCLHSPLQGLCHCPCILLPFYDYRTSVPQNLFDMVVPTTPKLLILLPYVLLLFYDHVYGYNFPLLYVSKVKNRLGSVHILLQLG